MRWVAYGLEEQTNENEPSKFLDGAPAALKGFEEFVVIEEILDFEQGKSFVSTSILMSKAYNDT